MATVSQPVWQKKVSLLCSSEECWELFALSASASGQLSFAVSGCTRTHKLFFLACIIFYVALCKKHSGVMCYGCLFLLMVSEKLWLEVELASECVLLNP